MPKKGCAFGYCKLLLHRGFCIFEADDWTSDGVQSCDHSKSPGNGYMHVGSYKNPHRNHHLAASFHSSSCGRFGSVTVQGRLFK
jgi:hypothetical protein